MIRELFLKDYLVNVKKDNMYFIEAHVGEIYFSYNTYCLKSGREVTLYECAVAGWVNKLILPDKTEEPCFISCIIDGEDVYYTYSSENLNNELYYNLDVRHGRLLEVCC